MSNVSHLTFRSNTTFQHNTWALWYAYPILAELKNSITVETAPTFTATDKQPLLLHFCGISNLPCAASQVQTAVKLMLFEE
jgi:hypothetical protein